MRALILLCITTTFAGCAAPHVDPFSRPLVDKPETVPLFEGKEIRLVGLVSNSKIPEIHGVDVTSNNPDLRGQQAEAYGVLRRIVISESEASALDRAMVAHRGAGTYWLLEDPKTKAPAQVQRPIIVAPIAEE
jgi:hypothetical protein